MEHSQTRIKEKIKEHSQTDRVKITEIKCGLFSKQLLQRTEQHISCTKPLGDNKFA